MRSCEVAKELVTNKQNHRTSSASATPPVMDGEAINRALRRIAHEIIERNSELASVDSGGDSVTRRRDRPPDCGCYSIVGEGAG